MVCRLHPRQVQPNYTIPTLMEHTTHIALSIIPFEQVQPPGPGPLSTALPPPSFSPPSPFSLFLSPPSLSAKSVLAYGKCHSAPSVYIK